MTMQQLLTACASGEMPRVRAGARTGRIQAIKTPEPKNLNMQHNGCAVLFDGETYEQWYHNSDETDKRRHYMRELELIVKTE